MLYLHSTSEITVGFSVEARSLLDSNGREIFAESALSLLEGPDQEKQERVIS